MNIMSDTLQKRMPNGEPVQLEMVAFFADFVNTFGLPTSIGEIFGYIFSSPDPVDFESVVADLAISRGSASQGLRFLQGIQAIRAERRPGERRSLYFPETSLRNLLSGVLSNTLQPRLQHSAEQIDALEALAHQPHTHPVIRDRVQRLRRWNARAGRLLPFLSRFARGGGSAAAAGEGPKTQDKGRKINAPSTVPHP